MRKIGYLVAAFMLTTFNVVNADVPANTEKCYGIAKAGQNDCSDGTTTCDKSVIDGDPNYFLYVPTGLCTKIVGGMLMTSVMPNTGSTTTTTMPATPGSTSTTTTTTNPTMPPSTTTTTTNPSVM